MNHISEGDMGKREKRQLYIRTVSSHTCIAREASGKDDNLQSLGG